MLVVHVVTLLEHPRCVTACLDLVSLHAYDDSKFMGCKNLIAFTAPKSEQEIFNRVNQYNGNKGKLIDVANQILFSRKARK